MIKDKVSVGIDVYIGADVLVDCGVGVVVGVGDNVFVGVGVTVSVGDGPVVAVLVAWTTATWVVIRLAILVGNGSQG